MGKKSKKKRQENQTRSVGDLADNVSRTIPENVEAAASGNISTLFDEFPDFVNDMQSALLEVFGEQLVSDNRSNIQRIITEHLMPGGGWVPRHTFNPTMSTDFHAWCVDERGVVHDYPPDQLIKGNHWTGDVVRRPWDVNVVVEALPYIEKLTREKFFDKNKHVSSVQFLQMIENSTFPVNHCYARAKILRDSDPTRFALVLGSLGYRQLDGRVFWECG
jgi:hypothetical protein